MAEIKFARKKKWHNNKTWYDVVYKTNRLYMYMEEDLPKSVRKWLDGKTGKKQYDKYHGEEIIYEEEKKMIKWLAVNEDDMIRAICDTEYSAMMEAEMERINDIEQGFTPDEYRFVKAEFIGKGDMWDNDIYGEENWREVQ